MSLCVLGLLLLFPCMYTNGGGRVDIVKKVEEG